MRTRSSAVAYTMILPHPISEVHSRPLGMAASRGSRVASAAAEEEEDPSPVSIIDRFARFACFGRFAPVAMKLQVQFVLVLRAGCMA